MATQLIHRVKCHPTLPLTITAHDDHHIRFFDNNSGKMVHSMVAHLDAVTSLAVDPNGLYLLSGSKTIIIFLKNKNKNYLIYFRSRFIYQNMEFRKQNVCTRNHCASKEAR